MRCVTPSSPHAVPEGGLKPAGEYATNLLPTQGAYAWGVALATEPLLAPHPTDEALPLPAKGKVLKAVLGVTAAATDLATCVRHPFF